MKMKIVSLFEPASSDGYRHTGDGVFHLSVDNARQAAMNRHQGYAVDPIGHHAVETEDGRYLLLKSIEPVSIVGTEQAREDIARAALAKLTPAELEALGLWKQKNQTNTQDSTIKPLM